jgi:hypothetical protein
MNFILSAPTGPLAQLAEHRTLNPQVEGSIPSRPTSFYTILSLSEPCAAITTAACARKFQEQGAKKNYGRRIRQAAGAHCIRRFPGQGICGNNVVRRREREGVEVAVYSAKR